jgi:hypothetical protein
VLGDQAVAVELDQTVVHAAKAAVRHRGPPDQHARSEGRPVEGLQDRVVGLVEAGELIGPRELVGLAQFVDAPHVRLGRYRRFRESAIQEWVCGLEATSAASLGLEPTETAHLRRRV